MEVELALEITVGPPQIAINQGHSVLVTDRGGQVPYPSNMGLYFFDTRLISNWTIRANGVPWKLLNSAGTAVASGYCGFRAGNHW